MHLFVTGIIAFISAYCDTALGMGYGTILAPLLLLLGYSPLESVFAVLCSQALIDIIACFAHHRARNADFHPHTRDIKVAGVLGIVCTAGVLFAVFLAIHIPQHFLSMYIGVLVFFMGVLMLFTFRNMIRFSWPKLWMLSFIAAFNKGVSGGGFGPVLMGGQILSGVSVKHAVGITAFAEAIVCLVGSGMYILFNKEIPWALTFFLLVGAIPAVPLAALTVQKIPVEWLKKCIAVLIIVLGILTIINTRVRI